PGSAVCGDTAAQLTEHGDDPADLVRGRGHRREFEGGTELFDATGDDGDLVLLVGRQRQYHRVEPSAQRGRQIVDPAVAVVRGGDDVEPLRRLHLDAEFRNRERFFGQDGDQ